MADQTGNDQSGNKAQVFRQYKLVHEPCHLISCGVTFLQSQANKHGLMIIPIIIIYFNTAVWFLTQPITLSLVTKLTGVLTGYTCMHTLPPDFSLSHSLAQPSQYIQCNNKNNNITTTTTTSANSDDKGHIAIIIILIVTCFCSSCCWQHQYWQEQAYLLIQNTKRPENCKLLCLVTTKLFLGLQSTRT